MVLVVTSLARYRLWRQSRQPFPVDLRLKFHRPHGGSFLHFDCAYVLFGLHSCRADVCVYLPVYLNCSCPPTFPLDFIAVLSPLLLLILVDRLVLLVPFPWRLLPARPFFLREG